MDKNELRIINIIEKYNTFISSRSNIIGVGLGYKEINGELLDIPCLKIYVTKKLNKSQLSPKDIIPHKFYGVLTDICQVNEYPENNTYIENTIRVLGGDNKRAIRGGDLIRNGKEEYTGGTLGYIVYDKKTATKSTPGIKHVLSSGRVLTGNFLGETGDPIYWVSNLPSTDTIIKHPIEDRLGVVTKFQKLRFTDTPKTESEKLIPNVPNEIDVGIVLPAVNMEKSYFLDNGLIDSTIKITGSTNDLSTSEVSIFTRSSGEVKGKISSKATGIYVGYEEKPSYFSGQITAKMKVSKADYGAVGLIRVPDGSYKIFGLLIGTARSINSKTGNVISDLAVFTPINKALESMAMVLLEDL